MKLAIEKDVYDKVMYWVQKAGKEEISGFGNIVVDKDNTLRVISAMLLPQKNGATHTDIEPEAICKALYELRDSPGDMKWWWHSHVDMAVFWSTTDLDTIKTIADGGWTVATVFNKKCEKKSAYYSKDGKVTPFGIQPLFLNDLETTIRMPMTDTDAWDAEFKKNVTDLKVATVTSISGERFSDDGYYDTRGVWHSFAEYEKKYPYSAGRGYPPVSSRTSFPTSGNTSTKFLTKKERRELKKQARAAKRTAVDEYGFSPKDWQELTSVGYDNQMIDVLIMDGFTAAQILTLATEGVGFQEIIDLQTQGFTNADILAEVYQDEKQSVEVQ